jgi:hypothetical protein
MAESYRFVVYVYFMVPKGLLPTYEVVPVNVPKHATTFSDVADLVSAFSPGFSPLEVSKCTYGLGSEGELIYDSVDIIPKGMLKHGTRLTMQVPFTREVFESSFSART